MIITKKQRYIGLVFGVIPTAILGLLAIWTQDDISFTLSAKLGFTAGFYMIICIAAFIILEGESTKR